MSFYSNISNTPKYKEATSLYEEYYTYLKGQKFSEICTISIPGSKQTEDNVHSKIEMIEVKLSLSYPREDVIYEIYKYLCEGYKFPSVSTLVWSDFLRNTSYVSGNNSHVEGALNIENIEWSYLINEK